MKAEKKRKITNNKQTNIKNSSNKKYNTYHGTLPQEWIDERYRSSI